ncbi:MAG: HupE/UreJ family protein [Bacteroidia bacterium]
MQLLRNSFSFMLRLPKPLLVLAFVLLLPDQLFAHAIDDQMAKLSKTEIAWTYLQSGFLHIFPYGFDHILFVLCLFLLNSKLKNMLLQATAFTVAHTITLGITAYGLIDPPAHLVEPIIALSIMFVALENVISDQLKPSRLIIIFVFGLIHGMGFAGALSEVGLPQKQFFTALICFNVGVEIGQLMILMAAWWLVGKWFSGKSWYRKRVVIPASIAIAAIALYWVVERTFF